jgi:hypothetical protein
MGACIIHDPSSVGTAAIMSLTLVRPVSLPNDAPCQENIDTPSLSIPRGGGVSGIPVGMEWTAMSAVHQTITNV